MVEIIAVCDVYDALIAPRPYRTVSYDNRTALEELISMVERGELDARPVKSLVTHNRKTSRFYCVNSLPHVRRGVPPSKNIYGITVPGDAPGGTEEQQLQQQLKRLEKHG